MSESINIRTRLLKRGVLTAVAGLVLGGVFTRLAEVFLPLSAARTFLTAPASMSVGPFYIDLVAVSFTLGPVSVAVNVLTLVGIAVVGVVVRAWV